MELGHLLKTALDLGLDLLQGERHMRTLQLGSENMQSDLLTLRLIGRTVFLHLKEVGSFDVATGRRRITSRVGSSGAIRSSNRNFSVDNSNACFSISEQAVRKLSLGFADDREPTEDDFASAAACRIVPLWQRGAT